MVKRILNVGNDNKHVLKADALFQTRGSCFSRSLMIMN